MGKKNISELAYNVLRTSGIGDKIPISENVDKYIFRFLVDDDTTINTEYGSTLYLNEKDLGISRQLYRNGITQPALTKLFKQKVDSGMKIVDIGAHIGYFTILFAQLTGDEGRVDAFEPIMENCDVLQKNVELNGVEKFTNTYNQAIWDTTGVKKIKISNHQISGSIEDVGRDVEVKPLDKVISDGVDLMKIDVDGGEEKVLEGSKGIINKYHPEIILEYNPSKWTQSFENIKSEYFCEYSNIQVVTKGEEIQSIDSLESIKELNVKDIYLK